MEIVKDKKEVNVLRGKARKWSGTKGNWANSKKIDVVENKDGNLLFKAHKQKLNIVPVSEADTDFASVLQDLVEFSEILGINKIAVQEKEENRFLIRAIRDCIEVFKDKKIMVSFLKSSEEIKGNKEKKIILNDFHVLPTGGHAGATRMTKNVKKRYHWTGMDRDIRDYVRKCDACQRFKHSIPRMEPMVVTTTASSAFEKFFLDIVGSIDQDLGGFSFILTMQCELSKFVIAVPLTNKEASTVARAFVENFVLRYGIPKEIATDCGSEFLAEVFKKSCKILHIEKLQFTPYHHESIGSLENSHKNLGAFLRTQVAIHKGNWSSWVNFWCFAYNTTIHSETKFTPFELVFGKSCVLPSNLKTNFSEPLYNAENYACELKYRLRCACREARENLVASKEKRVKKFEEKSDTHQYKNGDLVLIKNEQRKKLEQVYNGPYEVIKEIENSPNIILKVKNKEHIVHKNRIKPYVYFLL